MKAGTRLCNVRAKISSAFYLLINGGLGMLHPSSVPVYTMNTGAHGNPNFTSPDPQRLWLMPSIKSFSQIKILPP
jgi:hypothetical protein